jgi:drug/metabolite transporter (DMT)-like permease
VRLSGKAAPGSIGLIPGKTMKFKFSSLSPKFRGIVMIFAANVLFALNIPVSKELTPYWIDPFGLSFLRISFAFLSFFILSFIIGSGVKFKLKEHLILFICGVTGITVNQLAFLAGLSITSPVDASLIITMTPIITMVFSAVIIKEPITLRKTAGVLIGMTGAVLILYASYSGVFSQSGTVKGNLIVLSSGFVYSLYLVMIRPLMQKYPPVEVMKWTFFYGMMVSLPFTLKYTSIKAEADILQFLQLGYALLFGTFTAYLLVAFSLRYLRPTTVSMFNYVIPLLASFIAIYIGQDTFNWTKPVSAILIFSGVYFVITSRSREGSTKDTR